MKALTKPLLASAPAQIAGWRDALLKYRLHWQHFGHDE